MDNFNTFEQNSRDKSYEANLAKEKRITDVFLKWCDANKYAYKVNPTNSKENRKGSDVEIGNTLTGIRMKVDLKGCQNKYANICLSYERSYDGEHWFDTLNNRTTSVYIFIDEADNIYMIRKSEVLANLDNYKKVTVSPKSAGHYQHGVLIPKSELHILQ